MTELVQPFSELCHATRSLALSSCDRLAAAARRRVDGIAQLNADVPLDDGNVDESPRQVAVLRIAFPIFGDRFRETRDRLIVQPLTTGDPAVGGVDVPEREVVIRVGERGFRLTETNEGFSSCNLAMLTNSSSHASSLLGGKNSKLKVVDWA